MFNSENNATIVTCSDVTLGRLSLFVILNNAPQQKSKEFKFELLGDKNSNRCIISRCYLRANFTLIFLCQPGHIGPSRGMVVSLTAKSNFIRDISEFLKMSFFETRSGALFAVKLFLVIRNFFLNKPLF